MRTTYHGDGAYTDLDVCPRCGGPVDGYEVGDRLDEWIVLDAACPTCGCSFATLCLITHEQPAGDCPECGSGSWELEEPWVSDGADGLLHKGAICQTCGYAIELDSEIAFQANVVLDGGETIPDIEDAIEVALSLRQGSPSPDAVAVGTPPISRSV